MSRSSAASSPDRHGGLADTDALLDAAYHRIKHRGPDGTGRFHDQITHNISAADQGADTVITIEIALVHARLSIIDHEDGAQPMVDRSGADDALAVVFNGCIYNHRQLRAQLTSDRQYQFATDHSDTEVLLHGCRLWSYELPRHLEGMFAYALWDRAAGSLTLARDRAGEKPLYFWVSPQDDANGDNLLVVFASTLPAVIEILSRLDAASPPGNGQPAPGVAPDAVIAQLISDGYCASPATVYGDVHLVNPGSSLTFAPKAQTNNDDSIPGHASVERSYWKNARTRQRASGRTQRIGTDEIDSLLREAVCCRLEADVPLGCFLSGGVDSSLIAHYAQKELGGALRTFSVRMPDARYDESRHAETVAKALGTNHETLEVQADPAHDLIKLIEQLGQPFGDSSILPAYWVSKAAQQHVKVALSGDGGDELFAGYERYTAAQLLQRWRIVLRLLPWWPLCNAHPKSLLAKLARLGSAARYGGYADLLRIFPNAMAPGVYPISGASSSDGKRERASGAVRSIEDAIALDFDTYLPDDLLRKVDTASMSVGLEVRCPFLDSRVMDACLSAPVSNLMLSGERKGLLRSIARRYLPDAIINRPKMGFAIPIGEWFRTDFGSMRSLLMDSLTGPGEPFGSIAIDRAVVQRLIDQHMAGNADHGQRLFMLLTIALWAQSTRNTPGRCAD